MKKFIKNIALFFGIVFAIIIIIILLPTTYSASQSLVFTSIQKDSMLAHVNQPRIILIGGSDVAYGLSSEMMKDSLKVNVINTSIHAGLGLKYMMDNTSPYLKAGDILVIIPEYEQYYGPTADGASELLSMVLDVSLSNITKLDTKQLLQSRLFIPQYIKSKLKIDNYYKPSITEDYRHTAFNEYGDGYVHWHKQHKNYAVYKHDPFYQFNEEVFDKFISDINHLQERGIIVFVSFPRIQDKSFDASGYFFDLVYNNLKEQPSIEMLGTPKDFVIPDELTYDTHYHLIYEGVVKRTNTLIHFMKEKLKQDKKHNEI